MEQSPSREANRFPASQETPSILWNQKVHYRTHKCPPPVPTLGQLDRVHIHKPYFLNIYIYIYVCVCVFYVLLTVHFSYITSSVIYRTAQCIYLCQYFYPRVYPIKISYQRYVLLLLLLLLLLLTFSLLSFGWEIFTYPGMQ